MAGEVQINMISERKLKSLSTMEKVSMILEDVMRGRVVILEHGLDPFEEARLIETTMARVDEEFTGIEIQSYPHGQQRPLLERLLNGNKRRMTVIGPADRMKTLCRENDLISAMIT
ncbi:MAG: hypothetical protein A4E28_01713 [Methanocella sp. PtaU1.Bin125]|nr:MAG: hypothetical protein A4E28_01713 [Methanocella sp. PtaU1.Bin125]